MKNLEKFIVKSTNELQVRFNYKHGFDDTVILCEEKIPQNLHILIPYCDFFYVKDQAERESVMIDAPLDSLMFLEELIKILEDEIDDYLSGDNASNICSINEYRAIDQLRVMAEEYSMYRS